VVYDAATNQAAVVLDLDSALPAGSYRLLACGSTSIIDIAGNPLDGDGDGIGGDDFMRDFQVTSVNLLVNPNLDSDLSGWSPLTVPPSEFVYSDDDAGAAFSSGSALLSNASGIDVSHALTQCVALSGDDERLAVSGRVRLVKHGLGNPIASAGLTYYGTTDCSGNPLADFATNSVVGDTGGWAMIVPRGFLAPEGAGSVLVRFVVEIGAYPSSDFDAGFDNLRLAPVEILFADDFETGDTSRWH
jgi:hypothetical protein